MPICLQLKSSFYKCTYSFMIQVTQLDDNYFVKIIV